MLAMVKGDPWGSIDHAITCPFACRCACCLDVVSHRLPNDPAWLGERNRTGAECMVCVFTPPGAVAPGGATHGSRQVAQGRRIYASVPDPACLAGGEVVRPGSVA